MLRVAQRLEELDNLERFEDQLESELAKFGFDFFIYVSVDEDHQNPVFSTNIAQLYPDKEHVFDPFLDHSCRRYDHCFTGPEFLSDHAYLTETDINFIKTTAQRTGFISGVGVPVRLNGSGRVGGFNFGTRLKRAEFEAFISPILTDLKLFSLLIHRKFEELSLPSNRPLEEPRVITLSDPDNAITVLTPREKDVLLFLAKGFSRKEIAILCSISHHTVAGYLKSIYKKLSLHNKVEATLAATKLGLL